jgi:hypothetical protein
LEQLPVLLLLLLVLPEPAAVPGFNQAAAGGARGSCMCRQQAVARPCCVAALPVQGYCRPHAAGLCPLACMLITQVRMTCRTHTCGTASRGTAAQHTCACGLVVPPVPSMQCMLWAAAGFKPHPCAMPVVTWAQGCCLLVVTCGCGVSMTGHWVLLRTVCGTELQHAAGVVSTDTGLAVSGRWSCHQVLAALLEHGAGVRCMPGV